MQEKDVIMRIEELCRQRSWSYYRLVKESGISYSTLNSMLNKGTAPSLATLLRICEGFGITPAEFFDKSAQTASLTKEERELLLCYRELSERNRELGAVYLRALNDAQTK